MISDTRQHTYIDQKRKFYTFFLNFETPTTEGCGCGFCMEAPKEMFKGFHFFCFDQHGYCWFHMYNTTHQAIRAFGNGIFLQRPAWEADTDQAFYEPLKQDEWIPKSTTDHAYALETVREAVGLDLVLMSKGRERN